MGWKDKGIKNLRGKDSIFIYIITQKEIIII